MALPAEEVRYPHILRDSRISGGQPIVEGTRIPVATLVVAHRHGMEFDEILLQYPSLTAEGLHAALLYYLDHRDEVEALVESARKAPPGAEVIGD